MALKNFAIPLSQQYNPSAPFHAYNDLFSFLKLLTPTSPTKIPTPHLSSSKHPLSPIEGFWVFPGETGASKRLTLDEPLCFSSHGFVALSTLLWHSSPIPCDFFPSSHRSLQVTFNLLCQPASYQTVHNWLDWDLWDFFSPRNFFCSLSASYPGKFFLNQKPLTLLLGLTSVLPTILASSSSNSLSLCSFEVCFADVLPDSSSLSTTQRLKGLKGLECLLACKRPRCKPRLHEASWTLQGSNPVSQHRIQSNPWILMCVTLKLECNNKL